MTTEQLMQRLRTIIESHGFTVGSMHEFTLPQAPKMKYVAYTFTHPRYDGLDQVSTTVAVNGDRVAVGLMNKPDGSISASNVMTIENALEFIDTGLSLDALRIAGAVVLERGDA